MTRLCFFGGGNMAHALIAGLTACAAPSTNAAAGTETPVQTAPVAQSGWQIQVIDRNADKRAQLVRRYRVIGHANWNAQAADVDWIVLAVKPQHLRAVAEQIRPQLHTQRVLSIAAGVSTTLLGEWLGGYPHLARAMPNTPSQASAGYTGCYAASTLDAIERATITALFGSVGAVHWLEDEARIDALTAVTGSGPAYVFYLIEALGAAAQQQGFNAAESRAMAEATFHGALTLLASHRVAGDGEDAASLRARVTSKGGTTECGLASLTRDDVPQAIARAVEAARRRAVEMEAALRRM